MAEEQMRPDINLDDSSDNRFAFFANPRNWPLFYFTAKNMKAGQLAGVAERKLRHAVIPRLPVDFDERYEQQIPDEIVPNPDPIAQNLTKLRSSLTEVERKRYRRLATEAADGKYTFLNRSIEFGDHIDWNHEKLDEYPLLWRLKLQAFEFLEWVFLGFESPASIEENISSFEDQLLSWAEENPIGEEQYLRRSWIPHSVSLRILNWSRYAAWYDQVDSEDVPEALYREIYKNAVFLSNHVEHEIGGNHLIENAIALIMAGTLVSDHSTGWTEQGLEILNQAGETQFLEDGGHFERSPMYHIMVLMRYLTTRDLLASTHGKVSRVVGQTAEDGVRYLRAIQAPDGRIPLLNDAVYGEAKSASTCLAYAQQVGFAVPESKPVSALEESGYYWLGDGETKLLVDCGPVGPPHLPAHSHNDQLSINLWVDGEPILVDTGTFEYAPTKQRQYCRSVEAHNTVQVDGWEPIDIGGQYLMGRRTSPEVIHFQGGDEGVFEGVVRKQSLIGNGYRHRRRIEMSAEQLRVQDEVSEGPFTTRLHFHPEVMVTAKDNGTYVAETESSVILIIQESTPESSEVVISEYYPQFGVQAPIQTIEFTFNSGRDRFEYILRTEPLAAHEQADEHGMIGI